jgi:ABC-type lipoprotein release transport system permease subunit
MGPLSGLDSHAKVAETQRITPLGVVSRDPIPYALAALFLLIATIVATLLPAYRAMSSNPMDALRDE